MQIIERTIDDQGRINIPKEIRECLQAKPGDVFKVRTTGFAIELYPVQTFCAICGKETKNKRNGIYICSECVAKLVN